VIHYLLVNKEEKAFRCVGARLAGWTCPGVGGSSSD